MSMMKVDEIFMKYILPLKKYLIYSNQIKNKLQRNLQPLSFLWIQEKYIQQQIHQHLKLMKYEPRFL